MATSFFKLHSCFVDFVVASCCRKALIHTLHLSFFFIANFTSLFLSQMSFDFKGEKQWEQLFLTPSNGSMRGRGGNGEAGEVLRVCVVVCL